MKTSNKILIGLLIIIIAIPFIATTIFKYKIAHGQFTANAVEPHAAIPQIIQRGDLTNYKVIKIIGPDRAISYNDADLFTCKIEYGVKAQYSFWKQEKTDSMEMRRSGDTLVFQYRNKQEKNGRYQPNHLTLALSIPKWVPVILDHSHLIINDEISAQLMQNDGSPAVFYPMNQSILQLGTDVLTYKIDSAISEPGRRVFLRDTTSTPDPQFMPTVIHIEASNSQIDFHNHPIFSDLVLNMADSSTLTINKGLTVKNLTGNIDSKTKIEANAAALPALAPIIQ